MATVATTTRQIDDGIPYRLLFDGIATSSGRESSMRALRPAPERAPRGSHPPRRPTLLENPAESYRPELGGDRRRTIAATSAPATRETSEHTPDDTVAALAVEGIES